MTTVGHVSPRTFGTVAATAPLPLHRSASRAPSPPADGMDALRAAASGPALTLFRRMLRGELSAKEGMQRIASIDGWPIRTDAGYLVAVPTEGAINPKLAGDYNGWQPQAMNAANGFYWAHVPENPGPQRYKLVHNGDFRADPWARRYGYDAHGEYSLLSSPGAHLERWPQMGGQGVAPRTVHVWVPQGEPTHHLYVHDGQNLFAPNTAYGGWQLHKQVGPNTLVIGIETAAGRMHDLTPWQDRIGGAEQGGGGPAYADFVAHTVLPQMDARYGKPKRRGVMGSSLGGLMAVYQSVRTPGVFDFVASLSGTMGWGRMGQSQGPTMQDLLTRTMAPRPQRLYLDSGGGPGRGDNYDANRALADALTQRVGYRWNEDLWHWHERGAPHNEAAWRARAWRPIRLFEEL